MLLKCENLQRTGSYKIRGAYNRLAKLTAEERARGVVAASAGNHAQGVAFAARELGIHATIFMPVGVAIPKFQATRAYGADVVLSGSIVDETLRAAADFAAETGAVLIPPFDHLDVVAGPGHAGARDPRRRCRMSRPSSCRSAAAGSSPASPARSSSGPPATGAQIRVIGVQAANAAAYPPSLAAGEPTEISLVATIADGIAVSKPGALNFEIIRDVGRRGRHRVSEDDIARAMLVLLERAKLVVEPAGAVGRSRRSSPGKVAPDRHRPSPSSPAATSTRC